MDSTVQLGSESTSAQESQSSAPITILLQKPNRWNETHLKVARVKLIESITVEDLLGQEHVPPDGDPEFEATAGVFCRMSREQAINGDIREIRELPYYIRFSSFFLALPWYATSDKPTSTYLRAHILMDAVHAIMVTAEKNLGMVFKPKIPFEIPQLKFRGRLMGVATIAAYDTTAHTSSVPLAILSVIKKPGRIGLARYEVPHAIFQAAMAYSENASLDQYDGFVICLDGMDMYVSRVQVPSAYLRRLYQREEMTEDLPFYRSERFNILDPDGRRGVLKLLIGLFRYLAQSPQSKITQHHIGYT